MVRLGKGATSLLSADSRQAKEFSEARARREAAAKAAEAEAEAKRVGRLKAKKAERVGLEKELQAELARCPKHQLLTLTLDP